MSVFTVNTDPSAKDLRRFAVAMLVGFGVIGGVLWCSAWWQTGDAALLTWSGRSNQIAAVVAWGLGAALGLGGLGPRELACPVYVVWMTVGVKIGLVMSTILMSILFVLILPWFSLIVRLGDPLRKKLRPGGTYWEDHKPYDATLERMQRPF